MYLHLKGYKNPHPAAKPVPGRSLDEKRERAKALLGDKYLLHPSNRVQRIR